MLQDEVGFIFIYAPGARNELLLDVSTRSVRPYHSSSTSLGYFSGQCLSMSLLRGRDG